MSGEGAPGDETVLEAISAISGAVREELAKRHKALLVAGDQSFAVPAGVEQVLRSLTVRVQRATAASGDHRDDLLRALTSLLADPPACSNAQVAAWWELIREHPPQIRTLEREPVALPAMDAPQEAAWEVLLDLDRDLDASWVLIGGQMTMIHCLEQGVPGYRPTDDGDVVLDVWTRRDALAVAARLLVDREFRLTETGDGFAYRYTRGTTTLDLLLPDHLERQDNQPRVPGARSGLSVDGGNKALLRAERLPVRLQQRTGYVRRPDLLGALVCKAAALRADTRDTDRHREDLALLGQCAFQAGMRRLDEQTSKNDRARLGYVLAVTPAEHPAWRRIANPDEVREGLARLATPRPAAH